MPKSRRGVLDDHSGKPSLTRRMSVASFVMAIVIAFIVLISEGPESIRSPDVYIFSVFVLGAFAPKVVQRFAERSFPAASPSSSSPTNQ